MKDKFKVLQIPKNRSRRVNGKRINGPAIVVYVRRLGDVSKKPRQKK